MIRRLLVCALFVCGCASLFGQSTSITGTVTDPTGAVIPSATITIVNIDTGAQRETTSDQKGNYTIQQVTPGNYRLTAKAGGFTDVVVDRIELLVNAPATIPIEFTKLGSTTASVQVEATAVQVNTTDASLGNAINSNAIVQLPTYVRNITGLLALQAGVTAFGTPGQSAGLPGAGDYRSGAVNGGHSDQGNVTLDGADVNEQNARTAFTSVLPVTPDSVEEFRTTTGNGDNSTGRGSGADITLVTKSGTNEFHGSLFEYWRGTDFAANTFFNNQNGVPIAPLLINDYGGSGGGKIIKNKLFYFLNYEGQRSASAVSANRTVPSANLRDGIVGYVNTSGQTIELTPAQIQQIDPAGIGVSQAALKQMQAMPLPNNTTVGDGLNEQGYLFNSPGKSVQNTYIAKIDWRPDDAGKHSLFVRGELLNLWSDNLTADAPQFPGLPPNEVNLNNSKGIASGWTYVISPNLVSTLHYGLTREGTQNTGVLDSGYEWFRGLSTPFGTSTGITRIIPVHTISEDISWNHGAHDIRFGGVVRLISNQSTSYANSYSSASSNPSWLAGSGSGLSPSSTGVSNGFAQDLQYAMAAVMGLEAQGTAAYNYQVNGTVLPVGAPVLRDWANNEGEMYVQDTWKATRNFTVTAGIRLSLEPPVHEVNGQQASTNVPLAAWLGERAMFANTGLTQQDAGLIQFIPASEGTALYPFHKNWAPRLGLAYSPTADSGFSRWLFGGPGKTSIRAGFGMYYDLVGQPLAQTFSADTPGLSSNFSNPANLLGIAQVPRYTTFNALPSVLVPPPPAGGLPLVYPYGAGQSGAFAITNSIDQQLAAPYAINLDFSIGREFSHGFFVQGSYVGRLGRHELMQRDLAMPTNLVDPASGQTYFQAMDQLMYDINFRGLQPNQVPNIPFFQDMWSNAAGNGLTATQVWANDFLNNSNPGDATNTLNNADNAANCNPTGTIFNKKGNVSSPGMGCGNQGPWMLFNPQFSALAAWSSLGLSDYHAMQWTIRKRYSYGLQMDVNYTWSKSIDLGSQVEAAGSYAGNAFAINTWDLNQMRAVSSYDTAQQINVSGIYELPFGRGRHFGNNMNRVLDAIVGGWQVSGIYRQTSGLPFYLINGQRWPTNWNADAYATPSGPVPVSETQNAIAVGSIDKNGGPNLFSNPAAIITAAGEPSGQNGLFFETLAGQSGLRNNFRGNGLFNIDSGVYKVFKIPHREHDQLQLRWETYNLTNHVVFDPQTSNDSVISSTTFGRLTSTLTAPRQMQFAGRYTW